MLLIADGPTSYTKNHHLIVKARESQVAIIVSPPHSTHQVPAIRQNIHGTTEAQLQRRNAALAVAQ
jgi:tyrosine-protein phosphatase YwqE